MAIPVHHAPGGGFRNPWPGAEAKGLGQVLRWYLERNTVHRPAPDPEPSAFSVRVPRFGQVKVSGDLAVTWIGHSSAVIEFAGLTVLTDPIWSDYPSPVPIGRLRRWVRPPVALDRLPVIDLVLISHNHYDHLDAPTVRALARRFPAAQWITPLGVGALLRQLGATRVRELDWWDEIEAAGATIACTPAQHFSARGVHDRNRTLWSGFSVRSAQRAIYFAGDTGLHPEFAGIARRFGPFDVLLLPVGAYEPRWFMQSMHMNPEDALQAFEALGSGILLPIHWGTFKLTDEPMDEPPRRMRELWDASGRPPDALWLLSHGETRQLPPRSPPP
jgi:N-acyl-phosphatidylethanolamine-hydrolysing phospholipase D